MNLPSGINAFGRTYRAPRCSRCKRRHRVARVLAQDVRKCRFSRAPSRA